jgi:predicted nucleic acid-binding protein
MDVVYLDSGVLVELLLGAETLRDFIKSSIARRKRVTSVISFGEILYVAIAIKAERLYGNRSRKSIRRFVRDRHDDYVQLYESIKDLYSCLDIAILPHPKLMALRNLIKKYTLLPRDSIHIATALENPCNYFLTLDGDFKQISEEQLTIIFVE